MSHKFKVRQNVRLTRQGFSDARTTGSSVYEVVRLMPADQTGELSYRIKSGASELAPSALDEFSAASLPPMS